MRLLVHVDNNKVLKIVKDVAYSINHDVEVLSECDISSKFNGTDFDALVVDKKTWQRNASILKYFKVLEVLSQKPMVVLSGEGKTAHLKLKDSKLIVVCGLPVKSDELSAALENLNTMVAEV